MKRFLLFILLLILLGCTEKAPDGRDAVLTFHSFQGGGPGYTATIANSAVASVTVFEGAPSKKDSDGAGFDVTVRVTGKQPGATTLLIEQRSPLGGNCDILYDVTVDEAFDVLLEKRSETDLDAMTEPGAVLVLETEYALLYPVWADNAAVRALYDALQRNVCEIETDPACDFARIGTLPFALPASDEAIEGLPGDVLLYGGNRFAVLYAAHTENGTLLGRIDNLTAEELATVLSAGDATVRLYLEWYE